MKMNSTALLTVLLAIAGVSASSGTSRAGEQDEATTSFARIAGGAIFDYRQGIDGGSVGEGYQLVQVICSDSSKSLRVMLPVAPEDDNSIYNSEGPDSTLSSTRSSYRLTFRAEGKDIRKTVELKPVNDPKSSYERQFMVRLDYGDRLWKALTSSKDDGAVALIGQGGKAVSIPPDENLDAALKSCGLQS